MSGSIQGQGSRAVRKPHQPVGDGPFRPMQTCQKHTGRFADTVGDDRAFGQFQTKRGADQLRRDLEQLLGKRPQLLRRQAAMPFVHGLGQRIGDAGANPDHRRFFDPELHGDRVGGLEANAADVTREAIGVLRHDLHGVRAVGLVDAHRPRCADTVAMQEDHDFSDDLLLGPSRGDAIGAYRTNARYLAQALGLCLDRIKHLLAESAHQLLGVDRPDPANHPGAEVFLDAVERSRLRGF